MATSMMSAEYSAVLRMSSSTNRATVEFGSPSLIPDMISFSDSTTPRTTGAVTSARAQSLPRTDSTAPSNARSDSAETAAIRPMSPSSIPPPVRNFTLFAIMAAWSAMRSMRSMTALYPMHSDGLASPISARMPASLAASTRLRLVYRLNLSTSSSIPTTSSAWGASARPMASTASECMPEAMRCIRLTAASNDSSGRRVSTCIVTAPAVLSTISVPIRDVRAIPRTARTWSSPRLPPLALTTIVS